MDVFSSFMVGDIDTLAPLVQRLRGTLDELVRLVVLLALLGTGCGATASPTPTPGDLTDLRTALVRNGVTTLSAVAGESACPGRSLDDNAVHLTVALGDPTAPRDLFLYLFRAREFDGEGAEMDGCAAVYVAANPGAPVSRIERAPYRALGAGWSHALNAAIDAALAETVNGG